MAQPKDFGSKHGVDDMVMLSKISEDGILENLKKRYNNDLIYTYIGHVLISVNPFKQIKNLYSERTLKDYRGKYRYELPPHVYALADDMYRTLMAERESQCVIISGESGAGKTEASKKIMQYIAAVSGSSGTASRVKDIILESNPLLEAFGNAKTIRNNNSSRFAASINVLVDLRAHLQGKYMEIQFDRKGDPQGGRITNYLLEKSRVVLLNRDERSFHVFYQLLAGAPPEWKNDFGLSDPSYFCYLAQSGCYTVDGVDDAKDFQETVHAMEVIGISKDEIYEIFRLLAAILYLGNITFVPDAKDNAAIADPQVVEMFAYLIRSDVSACEKALLFRTITTGTSASTRKNSSYAVPQSVEGAVYSRDALAKAWYSRLFDYIIERVNSAMYKNDPDAVSIGILDIYGFEIFGKNGFEQFCINFVNEKLQQIFIELTLKAEQEEYYREGIQWEPIDYFNNKICCDLIEAKKPAGIFTILDDVCNFPKGTDEKFIQKLDESFSTHAHYGKSPTGLPTEFVVKHYAGDVTYNAEGFCDKNKDLLFKDLIELSQCTQTPFIAGLFPEAVSMLDDKKRPTTAGFKIRESINALVTTLSACTPHYIRCIKPNEKKQAGNFDSSMVLHQVQYLGLLENVRIRRAGYAYRQLYDKFFYRYRVCSAKTWPQWSGDFISGCDAILAELNVDGKEYQRGKTKIFIRHPETVFNLEELRERKVYSYANKIQRFFLRNATRNYFYTLQVAANEKVRGQKERRRLSVQRAFHGDNIGYRENFQLKAALGDKGEEKVLFTDNVNKYDRRSRKQRRILVVTSHALYLVALDRNPDKEERKRKPWVFLLKRRAELSRIKSITLSPLQDNFVLLQIPGEHDTLLECRRKTELLGTLMKHCQTLSVSFRDTFNVTLKGKGNKQRLIAFAKDETAGDGRLKSKKVGVASGLPKDTMPQIKEPPKQPAVIVQTYKWGGGGGGGGGASASASARSNPAPPAAQGKQQVKALYDFEAENDDELSFKEGDVIDLIDKSNNDWWEGELRGVRGVFPATYVELIKTAPKPAPTPAPTTGRPTPSSTGRAPGPANTGAGRPTPGGGGGAAPKQPTPPTGGAGARPSPSPSPSPSPTAGGPKPGGAGRAAPPPAGGNPRPSPGPGPSSGGGAGRAAQPAPTGARPSPAPGPGRTGPPPAGRAAPPPAGGNPRPAQGGAVRPQPAQGPADGGAAAGGAGGAGGGGPRPGFVPPAGAFVLPGFLPKK